MLDSFLHSFTSIFSIILPNCIGGVMVSMLASRAVDHVFEPQLGQNKRLKLVFVASLQSTQHEGKRADRLARNQDNVDICGLLFQ